MPPTSFCSLPSEIIWSIISLLKPIDLSNTRSVCKLMRKYCDHPANWKHILLEPSTTVVLHKLPDSKLSSYNNRSSGSSNSQSNNESQCDDEKEFLPLWNLSDLKKILEPHLSLVQTIEIWGVRDNIIRYLILHCPHLQDLAISGWNTLSDHALRVPAQKTGYSSLCLRRLRLIGQKKSNYTSLDAATFGNLIARCPQLEELSVVCCQVHIQADNLIASFGSTDQNQAGDLSRNNNKVNSFSSLKSLTVATKRTWSKQHVTRLFQLCSNLCFLALVPDSQYILEQAGTTATPIPIIMNNNQPVLEKSVSSVDEEEIKQSKNIVIYNSL